MNVRFAVYGRSLVPPSLSPALRSLAHTSSPTLFPLVFLLLYVARFNDTKVTYNSIRTLSLDSLSHFRIPFHSFFTRSFSLSLSNTGRVLSDKNSSLNKHTIQKLLSYRLTASVKRVVLFYHYFFFLLHSFALSSLLSSYLFKYLKKLALGNLALIRNTPEACAEPVRNLGEIDSSITPPYWWRTRSTISRVLNIKLAEIKHRL